MNTSRYPTLIRFILFIAALALCFWVRNEPFFWDTIQLGAMHGDWFYQQNFNTLLLPDAIDSGHIPTFGWYLAMVWTVFDQNLLVSHLAMVPWVFLLLIQLFLLVEKHTDHSHFQKRILSVPFLGIALFIADPVLLSQMTLISPDIILLGAFLLGINSISNKNRLLLSLAILILGLISMRGVMVAIALFLWQFSNQYSSIKKRPFSVIKTLLLPFLPAAILVVIYLIYHFQVKGWVGLHDDSPWAESFASVGLAGMGRQFIVLIWRLLDFGRVFIWISLLIIVYHFYKKKLFLGNSPYIDSLFSIVRLAIILLIILGTPAIFSVGLSQHRYFLPFFIIIILIFLQLLKMIEKPTWEIGLWFIVFIGLSSGNMWVYPSKIAQGWDASLAHKPYFECKKQMKKFISEENILTSDIGAVFPEVGAEHFRYLNKIETGFQSLDMNKQRYIFYSNVMNDFSDEQLEELEEDWEVIFKHQRCAVVVLLYHNPSRL